MAGGIFGELGGFLGLPSSPLTALAGQAQAEPAPATPPPAMPATPAPGATPAPPAGAPAQAPSSGELGFVDRLGNGFAGKGFFGSGSRPGDDAVDPSTGATVGQTRQANMSSMMQMGMLLMAAGMRQSSDSRAAMMAKAPGLLNNSDQINEFAKTRLAMANARLAERKQQQAEQQAAYARSLSSAMFGGSGAATIDGAGAGGGGAPGVGAPIAPGADAGGAPAAPVGGGGPTPGISPAPGVTGPAPTPGATGPAPAPAQAPGGSGGVGGLNQNNARRLQALAIAGMDPDKQLEALARVAGEIASTETLGTPYTNPRTGQEVVDVFKNGVRTRIQPVGSLLGKVEEQGHRKITKVGDTVTGIDAAPENPVAREFRQSEMDLVKGDRDTLKKEYQENVQRSLSTYDKLANVRKDVEAGKGYFGAVEGNTYARGALNALSSISPGLKEISEHLNVTSNFERVMKGGVAGAIQEFNGSQGVSNADREFAVQVMQAAATGNREAVKNALANAMQDQKGIVRRYNENALRHNELLAGYDGSLGSRLKAPTVDRDFDKEEQEKFGRGQNTAQPAQPAPIYTPEEIAAAQRALAARRAAGGQ